MIHFDLIDPESNQKMPSAIKFTHYRNEDTITVSPITGKKKAEKDTYTNCDLMIGEFQFHGRAYVHPSDQFDAEHGRVVSLGRALEVARMDQFITKKQERQIWVAYYSR